MSRALPPSNSSSARLAIVSDTSGSPFGASGATHDINTDVVWAAELASEYKSIIVMCQKNPLIVNTYLC